MSKEENLREVIVRQAAHIQNQREELRLRNAQILEMQAAVAGMDAKVTIEQERNKGFLSQLDFANARCDNLRAGVEMLVSERDTALAATKVASQASAWWEAECGLLRTSLRKVKERNRELERVSMVLDWALPSIWHAMAAARLADAETPSATHGLALVKVYNSETKTFLQLRDTLFK